MATIEHYYTHIIDPLYRTLPNKCKWDHNNITFPNMKITLKSPYQKLTLNGMNKKNKSVQYVETQLNNFWQKQYIKKQSKLNENTPKSPIVPAYKPAYLPVV